VTYEIGAGDVVDASGKVQVHQPHFSRWQDQLTLHWTGQRWQVVDLQNLEQGKPQ
jgi:hypothetical protein